MKCPKCGEEIPNNSPYCHNCGYLLDDNGIVDLDEPGSTRIANLFASGKLRPLAIALVIVGVISLLLFIGIKSEQSNEQTKEYSIMPNVVNQRLDKAITKLEQHGIDYNSADLHLVTYVEGQSAKEGYETDIGWRIERYFVFDVYPKVGNTFDASDDVYLAVKDIEELFDELASETCDTADSLATKLGVNISYSDEKENTVTQKVLKNLSDWEITTGIDGTYYDEDDNTISVYVKQKKQTKKNKGQSSKKSKKESTEGKANTGEGLLSVEVINERIRGFDDNPNIRDDVATWCAEMLQVYNSVHKICKKDEDSGYSAHAYLSYDYYQEWYQELKDREVELRNIGLNAEEINSMDETKKEWDKLKKRYFMVEDW